MPSIVEVSGLTKYYKKFLALDSIDFTVEEGEIFGFLGPNGAGKSTTVRILNTLLLPTSGRVVIAGYDLGKQPYAVKASIGLVPEISNPYLELTCYENLFFTGKLFGLPKRVIKQEIDHLLEFFELTDKRDTKAEFLSKGLKRRLTIAMGLINRPKLLFLDEPVSGLDIQSARLIRELIKKRNEEGTTIFLTTHQLTVANELCDRIAIIQNGKIKAIDSPENLRRAASKAQVIELKLTDMEIRAKEYMRELRELEGVEKAYTEKGNIRIVVNNLSELYIRIPRWAEKKGIKILYMGTILPSLEDVFIEMTETTGEKGGRSEK